ncbi:hypothetical protein TCAL_12384 [Tigriopus californicus]|uniref:Guanine nucleotide-binding protein subunit alpha n=1 Tax=Tigriopus californicus TaxID=6832 RepID=A0A553NDE2_TIGCA|nr:guanine nucleotide-binding protein subunit alpha-11-like [Tigriopus californicus]TRY63428.1 hypothetical protein TCAL_12384 [Tigriopus californicus]
MAFSVKSDSTMYCCASEEVKMKRNLNRKIDRKIKMDKRESRREVKLLLLGPGESGKSTLCKQLRFIYGMGYSANERLHFIPLIHLNILTNIQDLIKAMRMLKMAPDEPELVPVMKRVRKHPLSAVNLFDNTQLVTDIRCLWKDVGVQRCFETHNTFHLSDSAQYFLDNVDRMSNVAYVPLEEDIIHARAPTIGITEFTFNLGTRFRIVDVGGQRSERRKWIHAFDNVTAIFFVMALSDYDQTLVESPQENRLQESLALFKTVADFEWFQNTSFILFMNKTDVFERKISHTHLRDFFPDFKGPDYDTMAARQYIRDLFLCLRCVLSTYHFFTCATDKNNIEYVFETVKDSILRQNLMLLHML